MATTVLFYIFAGLAIGCALSTVYHRNPLYSAVSLVGVFLSLSCIYITLAAPFIAAVQILVYAGAIMVLVVFVIMLLNLDEEKPYRRLNYLYALGGFLGIVLLAQTFFIFFAVKKVPQTGEFNAQNTVGETMSIGTHMYTEYLLPVEIVGILLLMAIIGGVVLARRLSTPDLKLVVDNELERRHEQDEDGEVRIAL